MAIVWLCMRSLIRVSSVIEEMLPFDCLNFKIFFVLSHNFVSNGWTFMKLILNINDHDMAMHVKFHQGVISYRGVIALWSPSLNIFPSAAIA